MFKKFYPGGCYDSTYAIDFEQLAHDGLKGIIFDIDNTLVFHGAPADDRAIELFRELHELGLRTCLISNNKEPRVSPFAKKVDSPYVYDAHKPSTRNYIKAMEIMGTNRDNTLFVGDQLFTDVYGANRAGIRTFLVKPLDKKEEIQIVLKRYLEKIVLFFYRRHLLKEENKH